MPAYCHCTAYEARLRANNVQILRVCAVFATYLVCNYSFTKNTASDRAAVGQWLRCPTTRVLVLEDLLVLATHYLLPRGFFYHL